MLVDKLCLWLSLDRGFVGDESCDWRLLYRLDARAAD